MLLLGGAGGGGARPGPLELHRHHARRRNPATATAGHPGRRRLGPPPGRARHRLLLPRGARGARGASTAGPRGELETLGKNARRDDGGVVGILHRQLLQLVQHVSRRLPHLRQQELAAHPLRFLRPASPSPPHPPPPSINQSPLVNCLRSLPLVLQFELCHFEVRLLLFRSLSCTISQLWRQTFH